MLTTLIVITCFLLFLLILVYINSFLIFFIHRVLSTKMLNKNMTFWVIYYLNNVILGIIGHEKHIRQNLIISDCQKYLTKLTNHYEYFTKCLLEIFIGYIGIITNYLNLLLGIIASPASYLLYPITFLIRGQLSSYHFPL